MVHDPECISAQQLLLSKQRRACHVTRSKPSSPPIDDERDYGHFLVKCVLMLHFVIVAMPARYGD
jgi:hypothetical protein